VDSILDEKGHDEDIELILQEVENEIPADSTMDNEIKKIIEEIRSKKGSTKWIYLELILGLWFWYRFFLKWTKEFYLFITPRLFRNAFLFK